MSPALAGALAIVRAWTRLYTARMQPIVRDARRAEIESDLWELHEDARRRGASPAAIAVHMLLRLVLGIVDDVLWRAELVTVPPHLVKQALWAAAVASIVFVWYLASAVQQVESAHGDGINVLRVLYPMRPVITAVTPPPPPIEFVRVANLCFHPPPPPPPPPPR